MFFGNPISRSLLRGRLFAAGHDRITVRRALGRYCKADRYWRALQPGAARIDLQGQPAGAVTERKAAHARSWVQARAAARAARPRNATPLPEEYLVPGHLVLTVKFSELPQPLHVQDGLKIGIQIGEGIVTAILPPKVWRPLERAAQDDPHWVAAPSSAIDRSLWPLRYPAGLTCEGPRTLGVDILALDSRVYGILQVRRRRRARLPRRRA